MDAQQRRELAATYRRQADQLDSYARRRRLDGDLYGPESAEDAEQAATDYRVAADELDLGPELGR